MKDKIKKKIKKKQSKEWVTNKPLSAMSFLWATTGINIIILCKYKEK